MIKDMENADKIKKRYSIAQLLVFGMLMGIGGALFLSVAAAVTFDSDILPQSNNTYKIGAAQNDWKSINATLYFSGANVGIGVSAPAQTLEVNGGLRLNTSIVQPACNSSTGRGTLWFIQNSTSDTFQVCYATSSGPQTYQWYKVF